MTDRLPATRLQPRRVAKPWGRYDLSPWFPDAVDAAVGEIWFEDRAGDSELLVKLLFTAARLSVQVHPDDVAARAAGLARGKDEAWVVLAAVPPGEIGVGLIDLTGDALAAAAGDGSIVDRLEWRRVAVGEAFYSPAGTVHAIGAGLTLLEVQQNADVTYRLFDYGSDRPLDLDKGVAAARLGLAYQGVVPLATDRSLIASGPKLQIERVTAAGAFGLDPRQTGRLWVFAAAGTGRIDALEMAPGSCIAVDAACRAELPAEAEWFVAYARPAAMAWQIAAAAP